MGLSFNHIAFDINYDPNIRVNISKKFNINEIFNENIKFLRF